MGAIRVVLLVLLTTAALAQNEQIVERVRQALASSGQSDVAVRALSEKNFAEVESILARSKAEAATSRAELLSLRAAIKFLDGKLKDSAAMFEEASRLVPLRDSDSFTWAMVLVKLGDDARARSLLELLAAKHPASAIYPYWLGRLDYDQRLYKEAVEQLETAAHVDPGSARIWDSLGLALDMQGEMEQAHADFVKAVSLNRDLPHPSPWPPHDLGYLLLRMDRLGDAEANLREALRDDPQLAEAHYHLGRVLEKQGRDGEAVDEYRRAIALDTTSSEACYSLGSLYRKLNRNAEATATFAEYRKRKDAATHFGADLH